MLPKNMIDGIHTIRSGEHNIAFKQISSNSSSTTIEFSVPSNTRSIEIIGAKVVPEFSLISALVLAVSLLLIIGFTVAMHNRI